jgi:CheY-like chemotaxis protein
MQGFDDTRMLRVLVVDDYPDAAATLRILLGLWGHEVQTAGSGAEALAAAAAFRPDVVLLDVEMPRLHGGEVARRLRQLPGLGRVLIVATSGTDRDDPRLDGYRSHFDDYLPKPYNLERLERLLASWAVVGV